MKNKKQKPNTSNKHDQTKQPAVVVKNSATSSFNSLAKQTFTPPAAKTIQPNNKHEWINWANLKRQEAAAAIAKEDHSTVAALCTEIINSAGFEQYANKEQQAKIYLNRGNAYAAQGKFEQAIADYNKAIDLNPKDAVAYNNRGNVYDEQRKFDLAIADYNKAIELNPKDARFYNNLGLLLTRHRKHETGKYDHNLTTEQRKNIEGKFKTIEIRSIGFGHALLCSYLASTSEDEQNQYWSERAKKEFEEAFSPDALGEKSDNKNGNKSDNKNIDKPDTLLYKFKPLDEHVFTELVLKQLFLNDPTQWNDPFDGRMFAPFRVPEYQEHFKRLRMQSFCVVRDEDYQGFPKDPLNNFLMWSHYADEHQGVCLVYAYQKTNTAAAFLHPVKYDNQPDLQESHDFYLMKSEQWRYENEYRLVHMMKKDDTKLKEPCLLDYKDIGLTLEAIYFGTECSTTRIKTVKAFIKEIGLEGKIALYQMKNDGLRFNLEYKKI